MVTRGTNFYAIGLVLVLAGMLASARAYAAGSRQQPVRITGQVVDTFGAPVSRVEVSLIVIDALIGKTVSADDGTFVLNVVTVSEGTLVFKAPGFQEKSRRWSAREELPRGLRIVLDPAAVMEQVVVTATRTAVHLSETPASITTLCGEELQSTAALTLDDALRQVPGFQLFRRSGSRTANPTSQGVSLRGTGGSGASRALVLLDGIPLNDPFGDWVYWARVPRASLKSVEILRGGASNLYGGGAMGGVINAFTHEASAPSLSMEVSYGNQQTPDASLFAGTNKGKWFATLAGEIFHTDGYIPVSQAERGRIDTPAGARHSILDLSVGKQLVGAGRLFVRGSVFGESRTNGTPLQTNRTHIRQLTSGFDLPTKDVGTFDFRAYGGTEVFDQNFSAIAADRQTEALSRVQRSPSQFIGFSTQWSRPAGRRQTLIAGLEAREVRGSSDEIAYTQGRPSALVGAGGRERTAGFFAEDIAHLASRLFVTFGVREDHWRNYAAQSVTRPFSQTAPATVNVFAARNESAFSPRLSVLYKVTDNISVTASAYRAFRQPSLNELYRSFRVGNVLTVANQGLRAERLSGAEAGANLTSFRNKLNFRGTFFWANIDRPVANVTLTVTPSLITRQRQNLGNTESRGVELEAEAHLNNRWSITGGYMFVDARVRSFPANLALEGLRLPQVPRHQLTIQTSYTNRSHLKVGIQARASGTQFEDDQNLLPLDSFFTADALVSRPVSRRAELFVAAENLLNQRYAVGRIPVTTVGPPLLLRVGVRLHLGKQTDN